MYNCNMNSCCQQSNANDMMSNSNIYNNAFPKNYLYGHAYTPNQMMNNTFSPEIALRNGSLFPELVSPYEPNQSIDFINYLRSGGI